MAKNGSNNSPGYQPVLALGWAERIVRIHRHTAYLQRNLDVGSESAVSKLALLSDQSRHLQRLVPVSLAPLNVCKRGGGVAIDARPFTRSRALVFDPISAGRAEEV